MSRRLLSAAGIGLAIGATAWLVFTWNEGRQASAEAQRWIADGEALLEQDLARGAATTDFALANRAIERFRAALQVLGESSRARRGLGRAHLRRTEFTKAVEEYERALVDPEAPGAWKREAGLAYLNRYAMSRDPGDLLAGVGRYEEALAADPGDAEARWGAGALHHVAGDRERRDEHWNRLLREAPDSPWAARVRKDLEAEKPAPAGPR
ncbi:MAG: tetratricopeptide repeat protein [Planctomycetota bacterium]